MRRLAPILVVLFVFISFAALFAWLFVWPFFELFDQRRPDPIPFDSAAWKEADATDFEWPIRLRMVNDLLAQHRLVGKTKAEIDNLLGIPPKTGYFREYDYVYWLGPERGFIRIDSEWLVIKFTEGKVTKAGIARD